MIEQPFSILAVLLAVLAILFSMDQHPRFRKIFKVVPLLVFAYFVPTILSNVGIIPYESSLYTVVKRWLLPASLILLTLSIDVPAIRRLGPKALILFLCATASIVIGGPLAYLAFGWMIPVELGEEAWKGLAALSGSWIGGGANFVAIGESVGVDSSTLGMMVVVDVAVANVWMAVLLYFAGRSKSMDQRIGADSSSVDELQHKVETFQKSVSRPTSLAMLLVMLAIAFGGTAISAAVARVLPDVGNIISEFTWIIIFVTTIGLALSFSPLRKLEGSGASQVGSVFLYLLVATIGAHANFADVVEFPALVIVGAVWMLFHAIVILIVRYRIKAPIFFAAVGSQANVGGAASAPIVASAFHPALAPVGVLLAVAGYVLGTYAGLLCAFLLELVHGIVM